MRPATVQMSVPVPNSCSQALVGADLRNVFLLLSALYRRDIPLILEFGIVKY